VARSKAGVVAPVRDRLGSGGPGRPHRDLCTSRCATHDPRKHRRRCCARSGHAVAPAQPGSARSGGRPRTVGAMTATVEEIMRRDVAALRPHDSILKAWRLMLEHGLDELPVMDIDGRLLGIFSDKPRTARPLAGRGPRVWGVFGGAKRFLRDYRNAFGKAVGELMIPTVVRIEAEAPVEKAATLLRAHGVDMLVVVSDGVVVVVVTRAEINRAIPA